MRIIAKIFAVLVLVPLGLFGLLLAAGSLLMFCF